MTPIPKVRLRPHQTIPLNTILTGKTQSQAYSFRSHKTIWCLFEECAQIKFA